jgi:hypothetical protein
VTQPDNDALTVGLSRSADVVTLTVRSTGQVFELTPDAARHLAGNLTRQAALAGGKRRRLRLVPRAR